MTVEQIQERMETNDYFLETALLLLYGEQTDSEQKVGGTQQTNSRGFNKADSSFCSFISEKLHNDEDIKLEYYTELRRRLKKYTKQITKLYNAKNT